uniref:Apple domain-containing protein n=1 Tax=Acrobeloides nanus TaxID=290746 RepID=A0A914C3A0_9BILA
MIQSIIPLKANVVQRNVYKKEPLSASRRPKMLGSTWKNIFILLYFLNGLVSRLCYAKNTCNSIFVRWPRVRLNLNPAVDGAFSYPACKSACVHDEDPVKAGSSQQCSAFNHKNGPNQFTHHCQIYPKDQVQHIDGYVEADDRYSFYWKYCVDSERTCAGEYAFTFLSDRYMAAQEVIRVYYSKTLEDCLAECLNEKSFLCRSVSFNRTDGGCHLSMQNQLSKPALLKLNNNPNFRIDYYENNCFNIVDSFTFDYKCEKEGIRVFVDSKFPYSGALYGLYDFFTCRVEPKESRKFEYMFPYPTVSKNCSDSIRYKGSEMILEVVLSTDGIEPLYFITPDDLTYQARCPIQIEVVETTNNIEENNIDSTALNVLENSGKENTDTSAQNLVKMLTETALIKSQKIQMDVANATKLPETTMKTLKPFTKDVFALPLNPKFTTTKQPEDTTTTILSSTLTTEQRSTPISEFSTHISFPVKGGIGIGSVKELGESKNKDVLEGHGDDPNFSTLAESTASPTTTREPTTTNPTTTPTTITTTTTKKVTITSPTTTSTTPSTTTSTTTTSTSTTTTPKPTTTPSTTSTTTTKTTTSTSPTPPPTTSTSVLTTTWKAKPPAPEAPVAPPGIGIPPHLRFINENGTLTRQPQPPGNKKPNEAVMFDIFHHGQPAEAVVVGSRITLSFTPYYAIPPAFMHISGCQVEPIASLYEWEKEPLAIVKEGCQSDHVGLVCPPQKTDYGIRVMVEAFRYQSTTQIQYTCLIRVCPFAPCPQTTCPTVEGCPGEQASGLLSPLFNLRSKRDESLAQLRARWAGTPYYQEPLTLPNQPPERMSSTLRQQLMLLGGDHIVRKRLIVVNSEEELQFFVRTGEIPPNQIR